MHRRTRWAEGLAGAGLSACAALALYAFGGAAFRHEYIPEGVGTGDLTVCGAYILALCAALYLCGRFSRAGVPAGITCIGLITLAAGLVGYLGYASVHPALTAPFFILSAPCAPAADWVIARFALFDSADALIILAPCGMYALAGLAYTAGALPAILSRRAARVNNTAVFNTGQTKDGTI